MLRHHGSEALRRGSKLAVLLAHPDYRSGLRAGAPASVEHRTVAFEHDFACVLDVGANRGQFALFAVRRFPDAKLYCFEPFPEARAVLERLLRGRRNVRVYELAASVSSAARELHISGLDHSSSLLDITDRLTGEFPGTAEVNRVTVETARLDETLRSGELIRPTLLKLDVQGFELEALRGAEGLLPHVDEILVELSFVEFYAGQPLAGEIVALLDASGFRLAGVFSMMRGRGGECLQADFLFVNRRP